MASNIFKIPSYLVQYYEYDKKIESAIEMNESFLAIDGLFCPYTSLPGIQQPSLLDTHRLSLGCMLSCRQKPETLECLSKIGTLVEDSNEDKLYKAYICNRPRDTIPRNRR